MMYIIDGAIALIRKSSMMSWHVGEPLPEIIKQGRVVTLQVDGDELELILAAMRPFAERQKIVKEALQFTPDDSILTKEVVEKARSKYARIIRGGRIEQQKIGELAASTMHKVCDTLLQVFEDGKQGE